MLDIIYRITDVKQDLLEDSKVSEFVECRETLSFLWNATLKEGKQLIYKINNIEYGLLTNIADMTVGEYKDYVYFLNDKEKFFNNLPILIAILFRPVIKKKNELNFIIESYDGSNVMERAELFKEKLPATAVITALAFQAAFMQTLSVHMKGYLKPRTKETVVTKVKKMATKIREKTH